MFNVMNVTTGSRWVSEGTKKNKKVQEGRGLEGGLLRVFFECSDNF